MSDIGPLKDRPVYEEDQVLTGEDLRDLHQAYQFAEQQYVFSGDEKEASVCCVGHSVIEALQTWLQDGKPSLFEEER